MPTMQIQLTFCGCFFSIGNLGSLFRIIKTTFKTQNRGEAAEWQTSRMEVRENSISSVDSPPEN